VQHELREHKGVSALIYDQACAAETRRKRKRGLAPTPERRVVINDLVCEGCGDCNEQSNCLSVLPLETELGRKRTIDQSACNRDYSCLNGFCPSFVTIRGATPKRRELMLPANLPVPVSVSRAGPHNTVIAGVGGTGVVTLGKVLALAAHLEGKSVVELAQTGLAQKFGAVLSHVRIADSADDLQGGPRVADGQADLLLASDLMVAAAQPALTRLAPDRSAVVVNCHHGLPPAFIHERDLEFPAQALLAALKERGHGDEFTVFDATRYATELLGDAMLANVVMLGAALQLGLLPVSAAALDRAFEELGIKAQENQRALALGRYAAHDPAAAESMCASRRPVRKPPDGLDALIEHRKAFLTDYQDAAYAERYAALVELVRAKEASIAAESSVLTTAVARQYFRLLSYKDEYEVARLFTQTGFTEQLRADYEGPLRLSLHLAPPLLSRTDSISGRPRKREFGPWIFVALRLLARMRGLRGGSFDLFGYGQERRMERRLIRDYEALVARLIDDLDLERLPLAVALAELPKEIRGFGPVKAAAVARADARRAELLAAWSGREAASVTEAAAPVQRTA
jgi:indolepyruvate ferredoxin oxidoreductase